MERDGRVTAVQTPAGVLARGGELKAVCRKRADCFRKATFDARWWCDHGFATARLSDALAAYRCSLVACELWWELERYPAGTPLGRYLGEPKARVTVMCGVCRTGMQTFGIADFVAKIEAAGTGSAATPVGQLSGALIRGECVACRERDWRVGFVSGKEP